MRACVIAQAVTERKGLLAVRARERWPILKARVVDTDMISEVAPVRVPVRAHRARKGSITAVDSHVILQLAAQSVRLGAFSTNKPFRGDRVNRGSVSLQVIAYHKSFLAIIAFEGSHVDVHHGMSHQVAALRERSVAFQARKGALAGMYAQVRI